MKRTLGILLIVFGLTTVAKAQSKLYPHLFDLQEVTLGEGVFRQAMLLNADVLMQYDVDRLLTPFVRQAGIDGTWEARHPNFPNWGSGSFRLDGHVGGHYLSALAMAYAATGQERLHERMEYMLDMMERCQQHFDTNTNGLYGYIGGYPNNALWTTLYSGDMGVYNQCRGDVPFYVQHKVMAGLRDAYVYGGSQRARDMFLKLCDWSIALVEKFSDTQMQSILDTEHGGVNEMLADAYLLSGQDKYLTAARRYSHQTMVSGLQSLSTSFLDSRHANTQVPKYIGFERIYQVAHGTSLSGDADKYQRAAWNFWHDVVDNRTVCIGGNSVDEHFLPRANADRYINNPNGPESCNTNNMLRLTEDLFPDHPGDAALADFYERATLNHILSTQNPTTGGYVYFTSLRPQHYRMYSQVNQGMWCCVGTGMENHSKYGEFVYTHQGDTLFVNLFVNSELKNDRFGLRQETRFPYEQKTTLTVTQAGHFCLAVRRPQWATGQPSTYQYIRRDWKEGEQLTIDLPMQLSYEECPGLPDYIALRYGPVLLGAKTSTENLTGQFAGEGRMDHCPSLGTQLSLTSAPMLIGERNKVLDYIRPLNLDSLTFSFRPGLLNSERWQHLVLQPFFTVHEARYMTYFQQLTAQEWERIREEVEAEEAARMRLEERTLDAISTGEQQSDAGHGRTGTFSTGSYGGEFYIDAQAGQWFQYELETHGVTDSVSLMVRYTGVDKGRTCTIAINGTDLRQVTITGTPAGFYNVEYPIPSTLLRRDDGSPRDTITVRFTASGATPTPGVYYIRLLRGYEGLRHYSFVPTQWISADANRVNSIVYQPTGDIQVNGRTGANNIALQLDIRQSDSSYVRPDQNLLLVRGTQLRTGTGQSYLWWFNGCNHSSQVSPTHTYHATGTDTPYYFIWDVKKSGLTDFWATNDDGQVVISANGKAMITCFGLTAAATASGTAYIQDIDFLTAQEAVDRYPELARTLGRTPTAIAGVTERTKTADPTYDLCGRPTSTAHSDIYIQGGKKHLRIPLSPMP
ncbi:MAG: glycoside hydrolase family 127 protein [Bacteroidaceae bacterium]|nr:glycoside hydrolase family 127 protein [Bacteroidaceae bacterium]